MEAHGHGPVQLPGGPFNTEGRAVNEPLLAALTGAAVNGCMPCVESLLDEVAADPACVARLADPAPGRHCSPNRTHDHNDRVSSLQGVLLCRSGGGYASRAAVKRDRYRGSDCAL